MFRYKDVVLKEFDICDVPYKVKWINDNANNQYLHYDLPLTIEKTKEWFEINKDRRDRWDATVYFQGKPVGLFGLLNIDLKNRQAEDYSLIGDTSVKGQGIGSKAGILNLAHAFYDLNLNKVWGTIEVGNTASIRRWRSMGGIVEGYLHDYIWKGDRFADAYYVAIFKDTFKLPKEVYRDNECDTDI